MARSLHLSFICIPQSTRALDQGGVEPRQAVSPKALRPWTIPLRYSVGCKFFGRASVTDGKDFSDMYVFWDCVIGQIKIQNVRKFIQNGTKCAVTKDSRRLNLEEGEIQASRVTLVMRDTITSFLRRDSRVSKPFRSVSWFAVYDNTNDHTGKGIEAADMEYNGNDPTNLKGLALKFLDIIDRVEAFRGISRSQNEGVASFIHERIVAKLIILSLKIHIHVLWAKMNGRSHRAELVQAAFVPWLELWQVVVQHVHYSRQRQIQQKVAQHSTIVGQDPPVYLAQELVQ